MKPEGQMTRCGLGSEFKPGMLTEWPAFFSAVWRDIAVNSYNWRWLWHGRSV
ncbi:hypothetical protein D3C81_1148320 [compost metagenome]